MADGFFTCPCCEGDFPMEERHSFDGQDICPTCLDEETVSCECCGERIWNRQHVGDAHITLCCSCYDRHYTSCEECGRIIHHDDACYLSDDDDDPLCHSCYQDAAGKSGSPIADYSYKPTPIFYGDGTRYFGVELEIDGGGECNAHAEQILDIANTNGPQAYCKHDGSLDEGFEIVTHPMTLGWHREHLPWGDILTKALELGYWSHKARTCGLHVHVNRTAFGITYMEQEACIARVLYFFEKHWEELLKFSRRTQEQLKRWAARYGYKEQPQDILEHAKSCYAGRYTCVNLTNTNTVEFRMFRGTLKLNSLIATLQLVDKICEVALFLSDDELKGLSWTSFVASIRADQYPELVQYLRERRLYVNEPVETEDEE